MVKSSLNLNYLLYIYCLNNTTNLFTKIFVNMMIEGEYLFYLFITRQRRQMI